MSREDVVAVATRLFAVFLVLFAVRGGVQVLSAPHDAPLDGAVLLVAGCLLPLMAALLLWLFPLSVAARLLPVMRTAGTPISQESAQLIEIGCTLLGIWLFAAAISDVVYWATFLFFYSRQEFAYELSAAHLGAIISTMVEMAVALWLLLGYKGILGAIRRFRAAGSPR